MILMWEAKNGAAAADTVADVAVAVVEMNWKHYATLDWVNLVATYMILFSIRILSNSF